MKNNYFVILSPKSVFLKNVITLISGTAIAQIIVILISPVLTRLYTPNEFGLFGAFMAIVSILSTFINGRYDLAIIEARENEIAINLMRLSVFITFFTTLICLVFFSVFSDFVSNLLGYKILSDYLYIVPFVVLFASLISIFYHWLNRNGEYKRMSFNRVLLSISSNLLILVFGFFKIIDGQMILGYFLGQLLIFLLFKNEIRITFEKISFKRLRFVASRYSHYPKYLIPATLASEISGSLPIIIISNLYSLEYAGFFALAVRVTTTPLTFVGNAIGEVYRQKAADEYKLKGECRTSFVSTFKTLFFIGVLVFLLIYFFSPHLIPLIFGGKWVISATIMQYLAFLIFFQLLSTPLSYTITFNQSQKFDMILQLFRGVFSIGCLYFGYLEKDFFLSLKLYVIIYCIYYIVHSYIQFRSAKGIRISLKQVKI